MIQPETGLPITPVTAMASMNQAVLRARSREGYQYVRYRMMPGKNPASASPSSSRKA